MLQQTCQTLPKLVKIFLKLINLIIISILTAAILTSTTPQPAEENIGPTTCKLCHKTFKKSINLQLHMEKVHEINSKPLGTIHILRNHFKGGQKFTIFAYFQCLLYLCFTVPLGKKKLA